MCFHPLYRGTWFPTAGKVVCLSDSGLIVSIRYIAVLGFQRDYYPIWDRRCELVSIRYIAVLGFQPPTRISRERFLSQVSIRYIAVLGFQRLEWQKDSLQGD